MLVELAHSLNADFAIMAIQKFTARRETPLRMHSVNVTNFDGVERHLQKTTKSIEKKKL